MHFAAIMLLNQTSKRLQEKALESKKEKRNISAIKSNCYYYQNN